MKKRKGSIAGVVLVLIALAIMYSVLIICLKVIRNVPTTYYNLLPASDITDFDRDGIPDNIDDSDGDGVADKNDPTPYGTSNLPLYKHKFIGR